MSNSADPGLELRQIGDDDRLLTALAAGASPAFDALEHDRALAEMLDGWRSELDASAAALPPADVTAAPAFPSPKYRRLRGRRTVAAAAAGIVTVLGMTGTAAAISGPNGPLAPLHRVIFGASHQVSDPLAIQAGALLANARASIATAASAGSISDGRRAEIGSVLDEAVQLLQRDHHAPKTLAEQADSLRASLARIPGEPVVKPSPAAHVTPSTADADRQRHEPDNRRPSTPPVSSEPARPPSPAAPSTQEDGGQPATSTDAGNRDGGQPEPSTPPGPAASHDGSADSTSRSGPDASGGGGNGSGGGGS